MTATIKDRVRQLYTFLKEANQLLNRPVRVLRDQPKVLRLGDMPPHPALQLFRPASTGEPSEIPDTVLRISRPKTTRCPPPPESIATWLVSGWDDPNSLARYAEARNGVDDSGETLTVRFEDDAQRVADFSSWSDRREAWLTPEREARAALRYFELFYELYSALEKDEETLELMLGDGHLQWKTTSSADGIVDINHPILLKRVELRFDAQIPEFTVHETEREPELYSSLFVDLADVDHTALRRRAGDLESSSFHPLGWEDTDGYLRSCVQTISPAAGEFSDVPLKSAPSGSPTIWRDPVLFIRSRVAGIANAVDAIVSDIEAQEIFPSALAQITGTVGEWEGGGLGPSQSSSPRQTSASGKPLPTIADDDILLAKHANAEQLQIIRRLSSSGSVIVQGPPGTGKTHTIGNIIGHLLSQGKSILVTAQTAKALRVVREKVPEVLQPLCVSVLGGDQNARRQLESSIATITERLTGDSAESLLSKAEAFHKERSELLSEARGLTGTLREALENEYREIVVGPKRFSPSDAARHVMRYREQHGWIPGSVNLGATLPLTQDEIVRLYELGTFFTKEEEAHSRYPLPALESLPTARRFQSMVSEYRELIAADLTFGADRWRGVDRSSDGLSAIAESLDAEFSEDLRRQHWRPYAIVAGLHGGAERGLWEKLVDGIEKTVAANLMHADVLHHKCRLSTEMPLTRQKQIIVEVLEHLDAGGKLGTLQLITRGEWRQFIRTSGVAAGRPSYADHFRALGCLADLESARVELEERWNSLIGDRIAMPFASLGDSPEMSCRPLINEVRRCLNWHDDVWLPLRARLIHEGLDYERVAAAVPAEAGRVAEYDVIEKIATGVLPVLIETEIRRRRLAESEATFSDVENLSVAIDPTNADVGCVGMIVAAVRQRNPERYASSLDYARRLYSIKPCVFERDKLVSRLQTVAKPWAAMIYHRRSPHDRGAPPGDVTEAWTWKQLAETLGERGKLDVHAIQAKLESVRDQLRAITESLVDAKAWGNQLQRLQDNSGVRQALVGWLDTAKRLASTRATGRRNALLLEARRLMRRCHEAVPVWVMPISSVAESFDARSTRFDVVIVDEASQADLNALIPLYMAKQIIIVGDHEQVTPLGVGKDGTILENLRKATLTDVPNAHLFDNQFSIYDIGRQSFGDAVRLVEHFRCVPEIIGFSNQLSYEGKIRPLREAGSSTLKPACVAYRVNGIREGDANKKEAETIVDLVGAMVRHKEYAGKTIGIISMVKESQALLIQSLLHKKIPAIELEKRRIQVGLSAEFQGDERDVMFLSMVDSQENEGTLRAVGDGAFESIKKRYNVATSRARDQLWVVHSFDPDLHLKSTDIRARLLHHVRDPLAAARVFEEQVQKTESPFEREVLKRLTDAGFRVKTQWPVGYFRIDIVVEGDGRRLAVECDGDHYHPIEKLGEDIERQTILERLGWRFARIRGSSFYRDPEKAMAEVFRALADHGILPGPVDVPISSPTQTLLHELEQLIAESLFSDGVLASEASEMSENNGELQDTQAMQELDDSDAASLLASTRETLGLSFETSSDSETEVEAVLRKLGGVARVEDFLKSLAKSRGFQRLGRKVRANLVYELSALERRGSLQIDNGIIRIAGQRRVAFGPRS